MRILKDLPAPCGLAQRYAAEGSIKKLAGKILCIIQLLS